MKDLFHSPFFTIKICSYWSHFRLANLEEHTGMTDFIFYFTFFQLNVLWRRWWLSARILWGSNAKKRQRATKNEENQLQIPDSARRCSVPISTNSRRFSSHFASRLTLFDLVLMLQSTNATYYIEIHSFSAYCNKISVGYCNIYYEF